MVKNITYELGVVKMVFQPPKHLLCQELQAEPTNQQLYYLHENHEWLIILHEVEQIVSHELLSMQDKIKLHEVSNTEIIKQV